MLHQPHETFLPFDGQQPARTPMRAARARRRAIRRRLRQLLRTPALRIPMGVQHG
jgi:hypothetical protein